MGERLSKPIREKQTEDGKTSRLEYGICAMQGYRISMEDAYLYSTDLIPGKNISIFGICDGHGGKEVSEYISRHFIEYLLKNPNFEEQNYEKALRETFLNLDKSLLTEEARKELIEISKDDRIIDNIKMENYCKEMKIKEEEIEKMKVFTNLFNPRNLQEINISYLCGSTACIILITEEEIYISNSGDSRCLILNKLGKIIYKTTDHKCTNIEEKKRIEQAEGFLESNRIKGSLDVSRGFGDLEHKQCKWLKQEDQVITSNPDIKNMKLSDVYYCIIGCDGFFDPTNKDEVNDKIAEFVFKELNLGKKGSEVLGDYIDKLVPDEINNNNALGTDNCSAIVIKFLKEELKDNGNEKNNINIINNKESNESNYNNLNDNNNEGNNEV